MNIKDIKYYCSLVETKNFSKVAAQFAVSQPTITMAIKRLEKEFATTFFIRDQSHRELRLTEAGQQFFMHAQVILNELTVARQEIAHVNDTQIHLFSAPYAAVNEGWLNAPIRIVRIWLGVSFKNGAKRRT